MDKINYVAGLLSAPSLPSAVGSDQTFHRPILPAGVTHLGVVSLSPCSFFLGIDIKSFNTEMHSYHKKENF